MNEVKLIFNPPSALITLNRPEVRNALSPSLMTGVEAALDEVLQRHDVSAVILTGAGSAFCAGADLKVFRETAGQPAEELRRHSRQLVTFFRKIDEFPRPVIAAVNGPAMAGGCGLVSVCDIAVAAEDAIFAYTEPRIGMVPAIVAVYLVRICGDKKARELLLTARTFSAEEAREMGLINEIAGRGSLMKRVQEIAQLISENSPSATAMTKKLLRDLPGLSLDQGLSLALELNALARTTPDFREGVSSFLEKRSPRWKPK